MSQNESENSTNLTPRQVRALPYLVTSPTVAEAAREAEVARATLYRWMNDPVFRDEAASVAKLELKGLMYKAVAVFADAMEHPNPFVRLRAAQSTMYIGIKANDVADLEQRLDRIEDAMVLRKTRGDGR